MLDIPSTSAIVAAVGVLIGVVLAIMELRNITKTRQMELIMSIYSLLATREFMDAWEKIKPLAEDARKQLSQRKFGRYVPLYQWTEYLYNELQKREQQLAT